MIVRFRLLPAMAALAVVLIALPAGAADRNPEPPRTPQDLWKAVAASGKVESSASGGSEESWKSVSRGQSMAPLTHVRTLRGGRATMTRGGDVILVHPRSELILPPPGAPATYIKQESGSVLYEIESRDKSQEELAMPVEVETPFLVAGVKGTAFSIVVQSRFVSVSVMEGNVEVRSKATGERIDLFEGDMALLAGRNDRFEVYRSRSNENVIPRDEMSEAARTSRKEAYRLVRTASLEDESFEEMKLDLWGDFTKNELYSKGSYLNIEREKIQLMEEKQSDQNEDEVRQVITGIKP